MAKSKPTPVSITVGEVKAPPATHTDAPHAHKGGYEITASVELSNATPVVFISHSNNKPDECACIRQACEHFRSVVPPTATFDNSNVKILIKKL